MHWPLLVVARILYPDARVEVAISALLIAVLASVTSYYLIEAPIRGKKIFPSIKAAYICLAVSFIGIFSLATSGQAGIVKEARLKYVYGENALIVKNIEAEKNEYYKRVNLNFNGKSGPYIVEKFAGYTCSFDAVNSITRLHECVVKGNTPIFSGGVK